MTKMKGYNLMFLSVIEWRQSDHVKNINYVSAGMWVYFEGVFAKWLNVWIDYNCVIQNVPLNQTHLTKLQH